MPKFQKGVTNLKKSLLVTEQCLAELSRLCKLSSVLDFWGLLIISFIHSLAES